MVHLNWVMVKAKNSERERVLYHGCSCICLICVCRVQLSNTLQYAADTNVNEWLGAWLVPSYNTKTNTHLWSIVNWPTENELERILLFKLTYIISWIYVWNSIWKILGHFLSSLSMLIMLLATLATFSTGFFLWEPSCIMTSSNGNISVLTAICAGNSLVTGEFPAQRPVTWSFDVFFDLRLSKLWGKQWWFETPSCPLWLHCNGMVLALHNKRIQDHLNQTEREYKWNIINIVPVASGHTLKRKCCHFD